MGRPRKLRFPVGFFIGLKLPQGRKFTREVLDMNSTIYIIGGILLIVVGVIGIYNIRQFPGLALFASIGLLAGIAMIGKATKKF
jgi:hypothetical protein